VAKSEYNDSLSRKRLMYPFQAKNQLKQLGYEKLSKVPISQSNYLMALFIIAFSKLPKNLADVRDNARAAMNGRSTGKY